MTTSYTVPDDPKMLRETLCLAQVAVQRHDGMDVLNAHHIARIGRLIAECDRHRPLGPNGKHGDRHTPTCGCQDMPTSTLSASPDGVRQTPIQRSARVLQREGGEVVMPVTRKILSAALDVEEMARAADPEAFEDHPIERRSHVALLQWSVRRKIATDHARGIKAAILGPDVVWQGDGVRAVASNLVAVDDEGES